MSVSIEKVAERPSHAVQGRVEGVGDRFFELSLDMLCVATLDGYFLRLNPVWQETLGYTIEDLSSIPYLEFVHPEDRAATLKEMERLAAGAPTVSFENRYRAKEGAYRWISWAVAPDVEAGLAYAVARDVTERKETGEALRKAEQLFRSSFTDAAIGMALVGTDGRWLQVNRSLCEIVGYSEEELLTKTFQDITHPDDLATDLGYVRQMLAGEMDTYQMEKRYFHRMGT